MGKGWNYTEVLGLISAQMSRLENKVDSLEQKLGKDHGRLTKLETERGADYRWAGVILAALVFALQIYQITIK